jgi:hypothetical protein
MSANYANGQVVAFMPPKGADPALFKNRHADGELEDLEVIAVTLLP